MHFFCRNEVFIDPLPFRHMVYLQFLKQLRLTCLSVEDLMFSLYILWLIIPCTVLVYQSWRESSYVGQEEASLRVVAWLTVDSSVQIFCNSLHYSSSHRCTYSDNFDNNFFLELRLNILFHYNRFLGHISRITTANRAFHLRWSRTIYASQIFNGLFVEFNVTQRCPYFCPWFDSSLYKHALSVFALFDIAVCDITHVELVLTLDLYSVVTNIRYWLKVAVQI